MTPSRWTFFVCCASMGAQSAKNKAQSAKQEAFLVTIFIESPDRLASTFGGIA
jgi:hypothetical protein